MKTKIILMIPLLFLILAFSCNKKDEDNSATVINGLVLDSLNDNPLRGVIIQLYKDKMFSEFPIPASGYTTSTDSLGKFILEFKREVGFDSYYIELKKEGYLIHSSNYNSLIHIDVGKKQNIILKMLKTDL